MARPYTDTVKSLPRSTPESRGASSAGIRAAVEDLDALGGIHGILVLKGGSVIAESWWQPYSASRPHLLFSVSKSVTSTAVGLAIDEGLFGLDSRVIDLLAEDAPAEPDANLAAMTVRHLLSMTTGHATDTMASLDRAEGTWASAILAEPVPHVPGATFVYNTGATYLLSAIVQKYSGLSLTDYLQPRLFGPLGITSRRWEQSPEGIDTGGFGLRLLPEDVAKFGQLYLQHGLWEGSQLVPAAWIAEATSKLVANGSGADDWQAGYGYQFWQNRDGSYRGDGAFGQFVIVHEKLDAVIVITGGLPDMGAVIDIVFAELVPALESVGAATEVPASFVSPVPAASARDYSQQFYFPTNQLKIATAAIEGDVLTIDEFRIPFGVGAWVHGGSYRVGSEVEPIAASGGWTDDTHFVARLASVETPFVFDVTIHLDGDTVDLRIEQNVSFDPVRSWRLVGGIASGS